MTNLSGINLEFNPFYATKGNILCRTVALDGLIPPGENHPEDDTLDHLKPKFSWALNHLTNGQMNYLDLIMICEG
jgi:hypothetical protein